MKNNLRNTKISACVAFHNTSNYIEDLLNSIFAQTYKNWEIIICDNNSTQKESKKLTKIVNNSKHNHKIKIIRRGNIGTYAARWNCYNAASGDIVLTPDSDDFYLSYNFFLDIVNAFRNNKPDVVVFNMSKNIKTLRRINKKPIVIENTKYINLNKYREALCKTTDYNSLANIAVSSEILHNIKCDKGIYLRYNEDGYMNLLIIDLALKIFYINKTYYYYRTNNSSALYTMSENKDYLKSFLIVENKKSLYATKWKIKDYNYNSCITNKVLFGSIYQLTKTKTKYKDTINEYEKLYNNKSIKQAIIATKKEKLIPERKIIIKLFKSKHFTLLYFYMKILNFLIKINSQI